MSCRRLAGRSLVTVLFSSGLHSHPKFSVVEMQFLDYGVSFLSRVNSVTLGRYNWKYKWVISKHIMVTDILTMSHGNVLLCASECQRTTSLIMMTSSNWNIIRVNGHLCGELLGHRWIPHIKICTWINGWASNRENGDMRPHLAHYDVTVMKSTLILI